MRKNMRLYLLIVLLGVFLGISVDGSPSVAATTYTRSQVIERISKVKAQIKTVKKKYNADKPRVKKANKGKYYISEDAVYTPNHKSISTVLRNKKQYLIKSGLENLDIEDVGDELNIYTHVSGYVKTIKVVGKKGANKVYFVKGVTLTKNKYQKKLDKLNGELADLKDSLNNEYSFYTEKINDISFSVGKEYDLNKYLVFKYDFDELIWSVSDSSVASINDGVFCFNKAGTVKVSLMSSISGKETTLELSCKEDFDIQLKDVDTNNTLKIEEVIDRTTREFYHAYSLTFMQKVQIICGTKSGGNYSYKYKSSDSEIASIDENGLITVGKKCGVCIIEVDSDVSSSGKSFYIYSDEAYWKDGVEMISASSNCRFVFDDARGGNEEIIHEIWYACYGDQMQIKHTGDNLNRMRFTYESSDTGVATVDANGVITITGDGNDKNRCKIKIMNGCGSYHLIDVHVSRSN